MAYLSFLIRISVFGLVLLGACSSGHDESRPISISPEDYCQRSCEKAHSCHDTVDPPACRSSCGEALSALPMLRGDFLAYVGTCVQESSCSSTSASKCQNEARAQLWVSATGTSFCDEYVGAWEQCDATAAASGRTSCLEVAKTFDDSALSAARKCFAEPCSTLGACFALALPDVTLSL